MKSLGIRLLFCATLIFLFTGCGKITSNINPDISINDYQNYYLIPDEDDTRGVGEAIYSDLKSRGFNVEVGPEERISESTEIKVTYETKWWWDLTYYLLDLIIYLKDPKTDLLMASGQSHRPSLDRKPADEMVREVMDTILGVSTEKDK